MVKLAQRYGLLFNLFKEEFYKYSSNLSILPRELFPNTHKYRSRFYKFFFFLPSMTEDHYVHFNPFYMVDRYFYAEKFRVKPGYIILWKKFRRLFNKIMAKGFYRQKSITKYVIKYNNHSATFFYNKLNMYNNLSPANNMYNWKFIT